MREILKGLGLLSKRELEMLERDIYLKQEYGEEMKKDFYYGDESLDELISEYEVLANGYYIEDYR